jgi:hypothetical protein
MLKGLLLVTGLAIAAPGTTSLYQRLSHRTPTVLTCAEYAQTRPSARWLRVRNCEVDYLAAGYRESDGAILELFLPVRPGGAPATAPAALVVATRDPAVLALAQAGIGNGRQLNQEQFLIMMLKIMTALGASREIAGTARTGILDRIRNRHVLSGLTTPLAPGVVVVDLHAQPSLFSPGLRAAAGAALIVSAILLWRSGRRRAGTEPLWEPAEAIRPPEPPKVAGTFAEKVPATFAEKVPATSPEKVPGTGAGRLRGLLLLNLAPREGREQIEYAAPLGSRADTIGRIARTIEGIEFDVRGRGRIRTADYAVIVDIGRDDPVSTAIAGADGAGGANAIRRLLIETGWRAYVPAAGDFIDAGDLQTPPVPAGVLR